MPIIFAYVANTYNIINSFKDEEREFKDYLANNVGIGLTIVFIIPSIAKSDAFDAEWKWNYVYVVWILASLVLSLRRTWCDGRSPCSGSATAQT